MSAGLAPLCLSCLRYSGVRPGIGHACTAFEDTAIPVAILASSHDHHAPYRGDHGLTYLPDATVDVSMAARADAADEPLQAAGILFVTPDEEVLLVRRTAAGDHEGEWSLPGGKLEDGETAEQAARREASEEISWEDDAVPLSEWTRRRRDGVDFTTFLVKLKTKFEPKLNEEHDRHAWVKRGDLLKSSEKDVEATSSRQDSAAVKPRVAVRPDGTIEVY